MRRAHRLKSTAHLILGAGMMGAAFLNLEGSREPKAWLALLILGLVTFGLEVPELARMDTDGADYDTPERAARRRAFETHYQRAGWPGYAFARTAEGIYAQATMNEAWHRWQEHEDFLASMDQAMASARLDPIAQATPAVGAASVAPATEVLPALAPEPAAPVAPGAPGSAPAGQAEAAPAAACAQDDWAVPAPSVPAAGHTDILPGYVYYCEERDNFFDARTHNRKGPEFYLRWHGRSAEFPKAPFGQ